MNGREKTKKKLQVEGWMDEWAETLSHDSSIHRTIIIKFLSGKIYLNVRSPQPPSSFPLPPLLPDCSSSQKWEPKTPSSVGIVHIALPSPRSEISEIFDLRFEQ